MWHENFAEYLKYKKGAYLKTYLQATIYTIVLHVAVKYRYRKAGAYIFALELLLLLFFFLPKLIKFRT